MNNTNPYDRLGVPRNASMEQVKAAYKKLAMIHHPDKGGNPETFKEINDAFGRIAHPEQYNNPNASSNFQDVDPFFREFATHFFNGAGGGFPFTFNTHTMPRGMPMRRMMEVRISLEAVFQGKRFCVNGVNVDIPANTPFNTKIEVPGTSIILITAPKKHDTFDVENGTLDLVMRYSISLCEALTGFKAKIKHPNGECLFVHTGKNKVIQHQGMLRVLGKGLPTHKGMSDLKIIFDVSIPSKFDVDKYEHVLKEMFDWNIPDIVKQPNDVCVELV